MNPASPETLRVKITRNMENPTFRDLAFATKGKLQEIISRGDIEATLRDAGFQTEQEVLSLTDFVINAGAFQIFATLVLMERPSLIATFKKGWETGNANVLKLPIEYTDDGKNGTIQILLDEVNAMFRHRGSPWTEGDIESFCERYQWKFSPPTFKVDTFRYEFKHRTILPFTSRCKLGGAPAGSAYLRKVTVHKAYITLRRDQSPCFDERGNPTLVLKTLNPSSEVKTRAEKEAHNLEIVRKLHSHNLIKAVAYYQLHTADRTNHCFLFPLAKYGDLWTYWAARKELEETEGGVPHRGDTPFLVWIFTQLIGMADALVELHKPNPNIRHGDLKPINILCFQDDKPPANAPPIRLVITDVGISKAHQGKTETRAITSTEVSTDRYQPPEMNLTRKTMDSKRKAGWKLSRRFDVWSMGCIILEFLIWLLYDFKELHKFTVAFKDGPFYTKADKKPACVRSEVKECMSRIKKDKRNCAPGTPLRRLLSLIEEKLLVVRVKSLEPPQDATTEPPAKGLGFLWCGSRAKEKGEGKRSERVASFFEGLKGGPCRISAEEMSEELKEILKLIEYNGFEINRASG